MIDSCICHQIPFLLVLEIAKQKSISTVEKIKEQNIACTKCGLCEKYVEESLKTEKTKFSLDYFD